MSDCMKGKLKKVEYSRKNSLDKNMKSQNKKPCAFCQSAIADGEELVLKSTLELLLDRDTVRIYKCTKCKTVWCAADIPYGGLYSDVDWTNISVPYWRDHWYWKIGQIPGS